MVEAKVFDSSESELNFERGPLLFNVAEAT